MPMPGAPQAPGVGLGTSRSGTTLGRSGSMKGYAKRQAVVQHGSPVAAAAAAMSPEEVQECRRRLEETKKEVRQIRSMEGQMKWNMQREEKKDRALEAKTVNEDIRDWRWKESDEMKAYVAEKQHDIKITELRDSKTYQEFKREKKALQREEDRRLNSEDYNKDTDHAAWRAEMTRVVLDQEKELVQFRVEDLMEAKEVRSNQKLQEKFELEEERALEQSLEMANIQRELAKEKEQLLQSLDYARMCKRTVPLASGRNSSRPSVGRVP